MLGGTKVGKDGNFGLKNMKYQVIVPKPSAKRMKKGKIVIELENGWEVYPRKIYDIDADIGKFEFEVGDSFEYIHDTSVIDGDTFNVYVEFSNDVGSRTERAYLVPMKNGTPN